MKTRHTVYLRDAVRVFEISFPLVKRVFALPLTDGTVAPLVLEALYMITNESCTANQSRELSASLGIGHKMRALAALLSELAPAKFHALSTEGRQLHKELKQLVLQLLAVQPTFFDAMPMPNGYMLYDTLTEAQVLALEQRLAMPPPVLPAAQVAPQGGQPAGGNNDDA